MHLPTSRAQERNHRHPKCCPGATICSPKRPSKPKSKYRPRTEYQDAYKAYSPETIRRIYQENRRAMKKYQRRNIEGTKESPRDLVPVNNHPFSPRHEDKAKSLPSHVLPLKKRLEDKVVSPECHKWSPVSNSCPSVCRCPPAPCRHPKTASQSVLLPRFHWCSDLACHPAARHAKLKRKTWLT